MAQSLDLSTIKSLLGNVVTATWPDDDIVLCGQCLRIIHRAGEVKGYTQPCPFDRFPGPHEIKTDRVATFTGVLTSINGTEIVLNESLYIQASAIKKITRA